MPIPVYSVGKGGGRIGVIIEVNASAYSYHTMEKIICPTENKPAWETISSEDSTFTFTESSGSSITKRIPL